MTSDLPAVARIVRLPDGRWGVENGHGVADLTRFDMEQIHNAFMLWAQVRWERAADRGIGNDT